MDSSLEGQCVDVLCAYGSSRKTIYAINKPRWIDNEGFTQTISNKDLDDSKALAILLQGS